MADLTFDCHTCNITLVVDEVGSGQMVKCPRCQSPLQIPYPARIVPRPTRIVPPPATATAPSAPPKNRDIYRLLAFLLGGIGIHDFYAGRNKEGTMLLVLTVVSLFVFQPLFLIVFIIVVYEMITVQKDSAGIQMTKGNL